MSRPARKVCPEVSSQDRLQAHHEEKARLLKAQIKVLEEELAKVEDAAKAAAARRRISRLTGIATKSREHAERLRRTPSDGPA